MIARILAAFYRRRDAKAKARRIGEALRDLAQLDLDLRGQTPAPPLVVLPAGFTCLRCEENPALEDRLWCAVCAPIIDALPAEPIDGGLDGCISRHPAATQRTGEQK